MLFSGDEDLLDESVVYVHFVLAREDWLNRGFLFAFL